MAEAGVGRDLAGARIVTLPARPEPIRVAVDDTAIVVIDMQNAYASPGGYLDLAGFDIAGAGKVIEQSAKVLETARGAGMTVIYFQNGWDASYVEAGGPGSPNFHKSNALKTMRARPDLTGTLLARGTWDYELVDALKPQAGDIVLHKTRYSGFFNSQLDSVLRSRGIRNIVLVGIATNVCVESTARDAYMRDFHVILVDDCAATYDPAKHAATLANITAHFGLVTTSAEVFDAWKRRSEGSPSAEV